MTELTAEQILADAESWWSTDIIDIHPGKISMRGYPIQELIGNVTFPEMIWLMLRGELPTRAQAKLFEAALVSAVDHGPQAPAIAVSRMSVTCGLPLNGAMASAINVLDDIHGGAGQQCMQLYQEIAAIAETESETSPDDLERATDAVLKRWREEEGIRYVPGFGHRFHPLDPRAPRLLKLVDDAVAGGVVSGDYARIGRAVEASISRGRTLIPMNIDGVTAVVYSELGFAPELGRGIFILSRSVGILAHAWEQQSQGGRIKGPMPKSLPSRYTGVPRRPVPDMNATTS